MVDKARGMNNLAVTNAEVGLPGSPNTKVFLNRAKVVGLPGFMLSRPKNTFPFSFRYGLIKSWEPILTPPVVTIISQLKDWNL
jgi:hypothetical protein